MTRSAALRVLQQPDLAPDIAADLAACAAALETAALAAGLPVAPAATPAKHPVVPFVLRIVSGKPACHFDVAFYVTRASIAKNRALPIMRLSKLERRGSK